MDIHEYQAKELLSKFGVPIPRGGLAYSPEQATYRASELGGQLVVVKAQIHSGARGKAGGIKVCRTEQEIEDAAESLLGRKLVTHQTGPAGKLVSRLYIEEATNIDKEIYLGFVMDRASERIMVVASAAGGMDIEEISAKQPDTIIRVIGRPGRRHAAVPGARDRVWSRCRARDRQQAGARDHGLLSRLPRSRRHDGRDQSARHHQGKDRRGARRQDVVRRERPVPPSRTSRSFATRARKIRARPTPTTAALPTSASTATSAASSTAPASPWPRST